MKLTYSIFTIIFITIGCIQPSTSKIDKNDSMEEVSVKKKNNTNTKVTPEQKNVLCEDYTDNACGVIMIDEGQEFKDTFSFSAYNINFTPWKKLLFSSTLLDYPQIAPYAFNYDNYIMVFRCTGIEGNFYKIIIDEKNKAEKLIPLPQKYLIFQTWQQYILKAFSVDFSIKDNPLKTQPLVTSKTLSFKKDQFYHPVEIRGNWLKVKDDDDKEGWIKWRDEKGSLIIQIFYDA